MKKVQEMTHQEFYEVKKICMSDINNYIRKTRSIVVVPEDQDIHNEYRNINIVLVNADNYPIGKTDGNCVDIIKLYNCENWIIDCLPCGFLRISSRSLLQSINYFNQSFILNDSTR